MEVLMVEMKTKWNAAFLTLMLVAGLILVGSQTTYAQDDAYDLGYSYGQRDKQSNRRSDPARYINQVDRSERRDFRQGYKDGYREARINNNNGDVWNNGNGGWNNGNGNGNGGWNNNQNGDQPPNWMIGTFRGFTPGNNTYTQITVDRNGNITIAAENGDGVSNGYYSGGRVYFEWGQYNFRRERNGFRALHTSNSADRVFYERID
jgi:hypothetical protein